MQVLIVLLVVVSAGDRDRQALSPSRRSRPAGLGSGGRGGSGAPSSSARGTSWVSHSACSPRPGRSRSSAGKPGPQARRAADGVVGVGGDDVREALAQDRDREAAHGRPEAAGHRAGGDLHQRAGVDEALEPRRRLLEGRAALRVGEQDAVAAPRGGRAPSARSRRSRGRTGSRRADRARRRAPARAASRRRGRSGARSRSPRPAAPRAGSPPPRAPRAAPPSPRRSAPGRCSDRR